MTALLKRMLILAAGLGFAVPIGGMAQSTGDLLKADSVDAVIEVRGMACEMCAQNMKRSLEGLDNVAAAHVQLDAQRALLRGGNAGLPTEDQLRESVTDAGYEFQSAVFENKEESSGTRNNRRK